MGVNILVINSGSSSLKYRWFMSGELALIGYGSIECIGEAESRVKQYWRINGSDFNERVYLQSIENHRKAIECAVDHIKECLGSDVATELTGIGHRVVHGGEYFSQPVLISPAVIDSIRTTIPLAPLHNPANLMGIEITQDLWPNTPQVAVFDTAYHRSLPAKAFRYAIPEFCYSEMNIRRYGFHGTSHLFVAKQAAIFLSRPLESLNLITLHLGNGASATAVKNGKSVDTSMGMTPLEGLIMGSRCGDLDPSVIFYLVRNKNLSVDDLESLLNYESGLKGICEESDVREIHHLVKEGDESARLALEMMCYRIKKYIGAYFAVLGRLDALVFTGGIGENDTEVRSAVCQDLTALGIAIDENKNRKVSDKASAIQTSDSAVNVLVIPTDEEREIAEQTLATIRASETNAGRPAGFSG